MTWKILKEDKTSIKKIEKDFKHAIKIIENTIVFYAEEGISTDKKAQKELDQAWDKVKDFAKKGLITDKYMQKWEHEK
tara:strand:+ start:827 stop:1060 length:234 start_codon:yes stop_codon:yes gene_type:complete